MPEVKDKSIAHAQLALLTKKVKGNYKRLRLSPLFASMYTTTNTEFGATSSVPAFLSKLWTLVDDASTNDLIAWGSVRHAD